MTIKAILIAAACLLTGAACAADAPEAAGPLLPQPPSIVKKGTIDLDLCETTPFVFKDRLYRLEWHRKAGRLRIMDHETQTEVSHFGDKHRFPCAFVEGDTVYVIGTTEDKGWCGTTLTLFTSKDLTNWNEQEAYQNPDFKLCNTSICKADGRYVMSIELAVGGFMGRYLESKDLVHWTLMPPECSAGSGSPHLLRWHDGWFYSFKTVGGHPKGYVLLLHRSRDLKKWEASPFNPVMFAEPADQLIANPRLTEEQRARIAKAHNCDNSDNDFCAYKGKLIINYCWGNQVGTEFIAEAEFSGTEAQYLTGWFPEGWEGIDLSQPPSTFLQHRSDYGRILSTTQATVTVSSGSTNDLAQLLSGNCPRGFAFHTGSETNPWVTIDLGREAALTGILVRNRTDCCQERAAHLRMQVSGDNRNWREIWKAGDIQPVWEIPLREKGVRARYVRLDLQPGTSTIFHLQHVEIWGKD